MRPTIALTAICKDEINNLDPFLQSVRGCFDKIYITDTGSTDGTLEKLKRYVAGENPAETPIELTEFTWINDFSAARNFSNKNVKEDYWMWLDLDDSLQQQDGFRNFRDNVMKVADYWCAPYHYSSDDKGNPVCVFVRERIFKTSRKFQWTYFLHEGVLPDGQTRMQHIASWNVKHRRTAEDLAKDRSRNLNIFEVHKDKLDARMKYYYGKELFETGRHEESVLSLKESICDPTLQDHDRLLAHQYLCNALISLNRNEECVNVGIDGIKMAPHRAEFYSSVGDSFIKMGQYQNAEIFYQGAKNCKFARGDNSAIFSFEYVYDRYPRNQLARIYSNMGDLDRALKEVEPIMSTDNEALQIGNEIMKLKVRSTEYKFAKPCDDIVISCLPQTPYEWDGESYRQGAMGGSETAAIEMAEWLSKLSGRKVKVFNMRSAPKSYNGVEYHPYDKVFEYMAANKPYLHIAWRHNQKMTDAPTFLWCHDLFTGGFEHVGNYNKLLCLTPFHKNYVMGQFGIPENKIIVTRNGLSPDKFKGLDLTKKDPYKFVFSSSPDRGLDRAMIVLDRVREEFPEVTLHIFYGISHLDQYGLKDLRLKLEGMMADRPWVKYHGKTEQAKMMQEFATSAYCVQPSDFVESSKITALEMACAGVYQITRKIGGCVDTLAPIEAEGMATMVDSDCITEMEYAVYADEVIRAIKEEKYKRVDVEPEKYRWEKIAKEWLEEFPKHF